MISVHNVNKSIDFVESVLSRLKEEYEVQAIKNQRALEALKFNENVLSEEAKSLLESCAKCCHILGLEDVNHCNLMISYSDLVIEKVHICELERKGKRHEQKIKNILSDLQEKNFILKRETERATKICQESLDSYNRTMEKVSFYNEKLREYESKLKEIMETMPSLEPELTFSSLLQENAHLSTLKQDIELVKSKLDNYRKLPSDMELAKEKVKQAKLELEKSQLEIDKAIERLAKTA